MKKNKKLIIFGIACVGGIIFYLWFITGGINLLFANFANTSISKGTFSKLAPGTSTTQDLENTYGKPDAQEQKGGSQTFFYNSSQQYQYEYAWTKDGKVIATKERLTSGGTKNDFIKKLGQPDIAMYDTQVLPASWIVYLNKGIAVQVGDDNVAYTLVRFAPQPRESFLRDIAPTVGMSFTKLQDATDEGESSQ